MSHIAIPESTLEEICRVLSRASMELRVASGLLGDSGWNAASSDAASRAEEVTRLREKLEAIDACPVCEGRRRVHYDESSVGVGPVRCRACKGTGKVLPQSNPQMLLKV